MTPRILEANLLFLPPVWTNYGRSFLQAGLEFRNGVEALQLRLFSDLTRANDCCLLF